MVPKLVVVSAPDPIEPEPWMFCEEPMVRVAGEPCPTMPPAKGRVMVPLPSSRTLELVELERMEMEEEMAALLVM